MAVIELQGLQAQVALLTERMDHMAAKVSAMHFTHEFCDKLEYESQLQLLRLRLTDGFQNAAMTTSKPSLQTAQLLHVMVETVLQLRQDLGEPPRPRRCSPEALPASEPRMARGQELRIDSHGQSSPSSPVRRGWDDAGTPMPARHLAGMTHALRIDSNVGYASYSSPPSPHNDPCRTAEFGAPVPQNVVPHGPATPMVFDAMGSTLEFDGLALGKGTWAEAYRQAPLGTPRREALKLLCNLGIVTEKELADDLTVISDEHIEECVVIALTMLQKWPPSQGLPPVHQAKEFFQTQLEALYRDKVPSPVYGQGAMSWWCWCPGHILGWKSPRVLKVSDRPFKWWKKNM